MKLLNQTAGKMNLGFKIFWGIGNLGAGLLGGVVAGYQLYFYQNILGMSASLYGLAITIFTIWNAINDPLVGIISDKTKSKYGRRVPYFRASIPLIVFSFIMLWIVPFEVHPMIHFGWLLAVLVLYDLGFTMFYMMYIALVPEITEFENERADLQFSYNMYAFAGSLLGLLLPSLINPSFETLEGISDFRYKMVVVGLICTAFMILTAFNVKERIYLHKALKKENKSFFKQVKSAISPQLGVAISVNFFHRGAQAIVVSLMYYVSTFVLKIDTSLFIMIVMLPQGIAYPFLLMVQRKISAISLLKFSLLFSGIFLILGSLFTNNIALVFYGLTGIATAGVSFMMKMPFYDCIDLDEVKHGERREGLLSGISAFVMVFSFLFTIISPFVLDATGFIKSSENGGVDQLNQPMSAIWGIQGLVTLSGILYILGFILIFFYKLKGERLVELREQMAELHTQKKAKYDEVPHE